MKNVKNKRAVVIAVVAVLAFVVVGAGAYFFSEQQAQGKVIATVNGEKITEMQVEARRHQLLVRGVTDGLTVPEAALYDRAIDDLITETLLYQDAVSRGITHDSALVEARYNSTRDNYDSEAEYRARLKANFLTDKQFRENIRRQVILLAYFNQLAQERVLGGVVEGVQGSGAEGGPTIRVDVEAELTQELVNQLAQERFAVLEETADIEVFTD